MISRITKTFWFAQDFLTFSTKKKKKNKTLVLGSLSAGQTGQLVTLLPLHIASHLSDARGILGLRISALGIYVPLIIYWVGGGGKKDNQDYSVTQVTTHFRHAGGQ